MNSVGKGANEFKDLFFFLMIFKDLFVTIGKGAGKIKRKKDFDFLFIYLFQMMRSNFLLLFFSHVSFKCVTCAHHLSRKHFSLIS